MILSEWGWNEQNYVETEYPDAPIREFVEFFRNTKQWRESDSVQSIYNRWQKLERQLIDAKNDAARAEREPRCTETTKAGNPCKGTPVEDGLCMAHIKARQAA